MINQNTKYKQKQKQNRTVEHLIIAPSPIARARQTVTRHRAMKTPTATRYHSSGLHGILTAQSESYPDGFLTAPARPRPLGFPPVNAVPVAVKPRRVPIQTSALARHKTHQQWQRFPQTACCQVSFLRQTNPSFCFLYRQLSYGWFALIQPNFIQ